MAGGISTVPVTNSGAGRPAWSGGVGASLICVLTHPPQMAPQRAPHGRTLPRPPPFGHAGGRTSCRAHNENAAIASTFGQPSRHARTHRSSGESTRAIPCWPGSSWSSTSWLGPPPRVIRQAQPERPFSAGSCPSRRSKATGGGQAGANRPSLRGPMDRDGPIPASSIHPHQPGHRTPPIDSQSTDIASIAIVPMTMTTQSPASLPLTDPSETHWQVPQAEPAAKRNVTRIDVYPANLGSPIAPGELRHAGASTSTRLARLPSGSGSKRQQRSVRKADVAGAAGGGPC